jgi:hypothetical protein
MRVCRIPSRYFLLLCGQYFRASSAVGFLLDTFCHHHGYKAHVAMSSFSLSDITTVCVSVSHTAVPKFYLRGHRVDKILLLIFKLLSFKKIKGRLRHNQSVVCLPIITLNRLVGFHEIRQWGHAIEGDLDAIIYNSMHSTILKWRRFKLLRCMPAVVSHEL